MAKTYYTYRIRVANCERVQVEKWDAKHQNLGQPSGVFCYQDKLEEISPLLQIACKNNLNDPSKTRALGEALFDTLFDDILRQDFVNFYHQVVQQEKQLLRVELDIDERGMPEVAALPWEFLCLPARANLGTIWMGTVPNLVLSRWRSQWIPAQPIQLDLEEKLKIVLVVSAPSDLPTVVYEPVQEALEQLANELENRVELLPIVNLANPEAIDAILSQEPHIFHFIGHGRLVNEVNQELGQIALVDPNFDGAMWVDADYFSELFNQHRPGVVMLQACQGGMLSASQAFVGVASHIIEQNIPVVVAMQYEITNSTASRFARHFYQQLAADHPVDIAVQSGRRAITLSPIQYRKRDFATPVIFMRVQDGYLFKREDEEIGIEKSLPQNYQFSDPSNFSPQTSSENVVKTSNLTIQLPPTTKTFEFEVVTIDTQGREKSSCNQAEYFIETLRNGVVLEMVAIPGGKFSMGAPREEEMSQEEERPQHIVNIKSFSPLTLSCLPYITMTFTPLSKTDITSLTKCSDSRPRIQGVTIINSFSDCSRASLKTLKWSQS